MWLKRFFPGTNPTLGLSESEIDLLISWTHRQLLLHDNLMPRFCKSGSVEGIAAWFAIPPMVALRCLGVTKTPDEKILSKLEAGIGELGSAYALGDNAKNSEYADVVFAFGQHAKLFVVYWLKAFAEFKPRSTFKNQPMLSKMLMALFESPRHGLAEHLQIGDPDDRYDYVESLAQLIKSCYAAIPELEAMIERSKAPPELNDAAQRGNTMGSEGRAETSGGKEIGIFEASKVYGQIASMSGDGMWFEIFLATPSGKMDLDRQHPIAYIRADEGDNQKFEVVTPEGIYSVPLAEIELAIEAAKQEVHSEDYYDNLPDDE
jgi:hypothetical protein